jgi:trehalose synthase
MGLIRAVPSFPRSVERLESIIGSDRYARLRAVASQFRAGFAGRTIWNANSTAVGGGVAEMLQVLVGYVEDLGVAIRWVVIHGDAEFFALTKRLHNGIHGYGDASFTAEQAAHYGHILAANGAELLQQVRPGDIVLLHDPQTAGLAGPLVDAGALVIWRCHIGGDSVNGATEAAWAFLRPHLTRAHGWVFSRRAYVPAWLPDDHVWIIPPSIDPFATKNHELAPDTVRAIVTAIGVLDDGEATGPATFPRRDGGSGEIVRTATVVADTLPGPRDDLVIQVSRWDRLKDMTGVLHGFARHVAVDRTSYLALVGPAVTNVADDPEGAAVYAECFLAWRSLPPAVRSRTLLVTLPLDDVDENAAMVNALQRHASIVTQKSLAEGFGLTVAEAMWKSRPVIGSAVGGINDQIGAGTGVLLPEPTDLAAFGRAVRQLLDDPEERTRMGTAAHTYVRDNFVGDLHLQRYAAAFTALGAVPRPPQP